MRTSIVLSIFALGSLPFSAGCRGDKGEGSAKAAAKQTGADTQVGFAVAVIGDGTTIKTLQPADAVGPVSELFTGKLADSGNWKLLTAKSPQGQRLQIRDPAKQYANYTAKLFHDHRGRPSIGLFAAGKDKPHLQIVNIDRVEVKTVLEVPPDPVRLRVFNVGAGAKKADGDKPIELNNAGLAAIGRRKRQGKSRKVKGWLLSKLLPLGGYDERYESMTLHGENGMPLTLTADYLAAKNRRALLKINNRGFLKFRVFDKVDTDKPEKVHEIHNLVRVDITR